MDARIKNDIALFALFALWNEKVQKCRKCKAKKYVILERNSEIA